MHGVLTGAAAGLFATIPMTGFLWAARGYLRWFERYPLPPRQITMRFARATGIASCMNERSKTAATAAAHHGYGAAMGGIYGLIPRQSALRSSLVGMVYGMAVWAGSYFGLLPALGILRPPTEHPVRRTALLIGAHVVWGSTLECVMNRIRRISDRQRS